jgi:serine protease Do
MGKKSDKKRYIWMGLIILFLIIWTQKDSISIFQKSQAKIESTPPSGQADKVVLQLKNEPIILDNQANAAEKRPVVVSSDEQINISVFERVHGAVVNIAATTLSVNFWMEVTPSQGQGTGFIIDKRGYILTNNHVVENAREITVTLAGGKKLTASLVGRDAASDLAVIKINDSTISEVADLGDSDKLQVGQKALAIGNPFGLGQTLTTGIISALNRSIMNENETQIDDVIQTDAPINPGNSGGPLLNSSGEVIGINTSIFTTSGGYQGIGFAIPINQAKEIAAQLIATGKVASPWLGIYSGIAVNELSGYLDFGTNNGILILQLTPGSPAQKAGLKGGDRMAIIGRYRLPIGGDIITAIDNTPISEKNDMDRMIRKKKIGDRVNVTIFRDGRLLNVPVTLTEKP